MSTSNWLAGLTMANATLQNTADLITGMRAGDANAFGRFTINMAGSAMRVGIDDELARRGNYMGYAFDTMIPYNNTGYNLFAMQTPMMSGGFGWGGFRRSFPPLFGGFGGFGHHHHHSSVTFGRSNTLIIRC